VDNNSSDDSLVRCQKRISDSNFKFIKSDINLGFSKANNLAVMNASSSVYHFLNPDTILTEQINDAYLYVMNNLDKVYVTPLINLDGSIENSKNYIPTIKNYLNRLLDRSNVKYWYIGASVIIPKDVFLKIGKWCEDYFMYSEDIDLFYQINKFGIKIVMLRTPIMHIGGGCSQNVWKSKERELMIEKSYHLFFLRNRTALEYYIFKIFIIISLLFLKPSLSLFKLKIWMIFCKTKLLENCKGNK
jgi:GT2 family glycosyltransferase